MTRTTPAILPQGWPHLGVLTLMLLVAGCTSEAEREADALYKEAIADSEKADHAEVVQKITRALELTNGGKDRWSNGTIRYRRGQALEALGRTEEALEDYRAAAAWGTDYLSSWVLNSDPKPGAKQKWLRTLSGRYADLGRLLATEGECEEALEAYKRAAGAAGGVANVGITDNVVAHVFGGERGKRREFAPAFGSYLFNIALLETQLGQESDARAYAERVGYDRSLILSGKLSCGPGQ